MDISKETSLKDYSLIGNCRSAALISRFGSIDWCCMPEFHSPAIFSSILDNDKGGFFSIQPVDAYKSKQNYLINTNIVETEFITEQGKVILKDCFTALTEEEKIKSIFPDHEILRFVEGLTGKVNMKVVFSPRIYYGKKSTSLTDYRKLGIHFSYKENTYIFQSNLKNKAEIINDLVSIKFTISQGEKYIFSLSCSSQCPAVIPEIEKTSFERMQKTADYWSSWAGKCKYEGIFKEHVIRSALVLKLLTHAPSGAIIAAPTTSLPEVAGGERNWDYRYCWLRDASFTIRVLIKLGFFDEAHAYMSWILHATQLTRPKLQVVYTVFGNTRIKEKILGWLEGYKKSKPVRIGNSAHEQFQLDVYGEVLDAIYIYSQAIDKFDNDSKKFILGLGKQICKLWNKSDDGIWEIRNFRAYQTHSKIMAWVGLDRLIKLCNKYNWTNAHIKKFEEIKNSLHLQIEEKGFNTSLNHYTREYNGIAIDAALMVMPLVGYNEAASSRIKSTAEAIWQKLQKNNFIFRYKNVDDGLKGEEGAFLICSFWIIENYAKSGMLKEAIDLFKITISVASNTGLLSEEVDPDTKELLGNYPQGFSHIGLINAVFAINELIKKEGKK